MGKRITVSLGGAGTSVEGDPVPLETVEELAQRDLAGIDRAPALCLGDELGAAYLCFALVALEAMPDALAFALCIAAVEDDRPVSRRAFADATLHFDSPFVGKAYLATSRSS